MPRITRLVRPVLFLLFVAIALIPQQTTHAATFTASNATELINAINTANSNGEADTITLTADITLTAVDNSTDGDNGLPSITSDITIEGAGFTIARRVGGPGFRVFHVATGGTLTLSDVTVSSGFANSGGVLGSRGGGILNYRGTVTISNSTLSGNRASSGGGGIFNSSGTVTISNSTLSGNRANSGGGLFNRGGTVTISNSTLSGNAAGAFGGGIYNQDTVTISNSTFSGNSAPNGGGIYNLYQMTINNSIITNSTGSDCIRSGAIASFSGANNLAGGGCAAISLGTVTGLDPVLADNGGPTWTHALLVGSNAINASGAGATTSDQRGVPAIGVRDIGAFESGWMFPLISLAVDTTAIFEDGSAGPTMAAVTVTLDNTAGNMTTGNVAGDLAFAGTATEGPTVADDYQQGGTALPFAFTGGSWPAPGTVATQTFTLTAWDDATAEGLETIDLAMSFTGPAFLVGGNTSTVGIIDNETTLPPVPELSHTVDTPVIFEETSDGPILATVTVTLDNTAGVITAGTVDVDFAFAGTATEGPTAADDYQQGGTALPLTFTGGTWPAPGTVATQSFTLTSWDDALAEGTETIDLTMSFTGPATLVGANSSTVGIIGDETALPPAPPTCPGCTGGDVTIVGETEYIEKTVDNPMPTGGQTVTYTITARNPKDVPLTQVVIYDVFDDLLENVQVISTTHGHAVLRGDTVTVSGFTLQPGESATVVVSAQITASFRAGDVIPNAAILESPDASLHVSNLVLVGDNCLSNDGEAVTLLVIPGQLPATGETSARDRRHVLVR